MHLVNPNRVLVTGAAGFIASHLIESLLRDGQPVVGMDSFDPFYPRSIKERNLAELRELAQSTGTPFEFHEMDIREIPAEFMKRAGVTSVVHLAAKAGVRPSLLAPEEYVSVNVQGTARLLELARVAGVEEFVFGSSSSVYGDDTTPPFGEDALATMPISPYAATKRSGELLCSTYAHLYKMKIASLRFFTVYGPRQRPDLAIHKFARLISSGEPITLYGDGKTSRDYTFVADIIQGVRSAMRWTGQVAEPGQMEIFNLGGSKTTTLIDLVRMLERELAKEARIRWEPRQPGDVEKTFADITKSARVLGYAPNYPIERGIREFVGWFQRQSLPPQAAAASS